MPRTFVWHPGKGPSTVAPNAFKDGEMVRIKQVRSGIGHEARMRRTLAAMGLNHHQAVIERPMSSGLRGQIKQVRHLIEVSGAGASGASAKPAARKRAAKKPAAKAAKG